jgi:membrane protein YqaA with SNARE-associated domain
LISAYNERNLRKFNGELLSKSQINCQTANSNPGSQRLSIPLLFGLGTAIKRLSVWLLTLGTAGLFGIAFLDSALVPIPGGPDAALIALCTLKPSLMVLYIAAATVGSAIGSTFLYLVARQAGLRALKGVAPERRERVEGLLGRYDMLAVMVPAVMPPPFPFKVFVLSAGVFKLNRWRFLCAILVGRAVRFLIEGVLAIEFGRDALDIIRKQGIKLLIVVGIAVFFALAVKLIRARTKPVGKLSMETQPPGEDL